MFIVFTLFYLPLHKIIRRHMISKNLTKFIRSLELKKNRQREGLFLAEGPKVVADLMTAFHARHIVATEQWLSQHQSDLDSFAGDARMEGTEVHIVNDEELRRVSLLQHPQQVLAVMEMPATDDTPAIIAPTDTLFLALDGIQDPGNLGTIIRIADWFGISTLICSQNTADAYNPKVVQATMGSLARVSIRYVDLPGYLSRLPEGTPVYGTFLDGNDIYGERLTPSGIVVMGNEGNGISTEVAQWVNRRLLIPCFTPMDAPLAHNGRLQPSLTTRPDSLNVAVATAVTCSEFRRRTHAADKE